jgi:hypothetical protein
VYVPAQPEAATTSNAAASAAAPSPDAAATPAAVLDVLMIDLLVSALLGASQKFASREGIIVPDSRSNTRPPRGFRPRICREAMAVALGAVRGDQK